MAAVARAVRTKRPQSGRISPPTQTTTGMPSCRSRWRTLPLTLTLTLTSPSPSPSPLPVALTHTHTPTLTHTSLKVADHEYLGLVRRLNVNKRSDETNKVTVRHPECDQPVMFVLPQIKIVPGPPAVGEKLQVS